MELAGGEEQVLMHLQESPVVLTMQRKRKHEDVGDRGAEEVKPVAPRELRFASTVAYEEPVTHGVAQLDGRAQSKKAKPPTLGHVLVKTLKGNTVRVEFPGTSISTIELKQQLEEAVGTTAEDIKLMCGSQFVEDYDKISSSARLFIITQVGATPSHR